MVPPLAVISEKREQPNDPLMCMLTEPVSDRVSLLDDSSGSAKRRFTKTKRVKFAVDARGNVVEEIHTVPKVPSSPGMHWCSARISEFQNNSRNLAAIYRHEREDLFETIETLYESPSDTIDKDIAIIIKLSSEEELRGLESRVFNMIRYHRRHTVKSVVKLQDSLGDEPLERVQLILKAKSVQASRKSSDFALRIARGDALVAAI